MTARDRATLKGYFNAGDVPTEANFADFIDSIPSDAEQAALDAGTNPSAGNPYLTATQPDVRFTGSVSVGSQAPTARLHLAAGTTGSAPFKLTTQAAGLTTVEQGAMELIGNSLQWTQLAKRRGVAMSQSTRTGDTTISNTADESSALITAEHGAGYLEVGKCEELLLRGVIEQRTNPNAKITIRVKYAGATIQTLVGPANTLIATNTPFALNVATCCRSTGSGGTMQINAVLDIAGNIVDNGAAGLANIDTTTAQNTTVTAQWGEANSSDIFTVNYGRVLCIEPNR